MYICTFKYTLEDVDCRFCKEYKHNRCTAANGCSCITERIEADAADYSEIVRGADIPERAGSPVPPFALSGRTFPGYRVDRR